MTGDTVMDLCWDILQDDEEPRQFYPAEKMIKWINEAVEKIRQKRPDSLIDSDGFTIISVTPIVDIGDTISLSDRWLTSVCEWVLMRAFQNDGEDEGDQSQSRLHKDLFDASIGE